MLKKLLIAGIILGILFRLALPYFLIYYLESRVNQTTNYHLHIQDLSLSLLKGQAVFKNIQFTETKKTIITIPSTTVYIKIQSLFKRQFDTIIILVQPKIEIIPIPEKKPIPVNRTWQVIMALLPLLKVNEIWIHQGELIIHQKKIDFLMNQTEAHLNHLVDYSNSKLNASLALQALVMRSGNLNLLIHFNRLAKYPTFDLDGQLKHLNLVAINPLIKPYTKVDIARGWINFYIEIAAINGKITGYAKSFVQNLSFRKQPVHTPLKKIYQKGLEIISQLLENKQQKTIATRIPIEGRIEDPNTRLWPAISNLIKHAFIQALLPQIDHNIDIQSIRLVNTI